jgi:S-(hydroxymethyl)glutathione dehydrogenase/alcohol dehydrogenase
MGAALVSAYPVIAVDLNPASLELAARAGATVTVNTSADDLSEVLARTVGPDGVDYAFEAIGLSATIEACYRAIRPGGVAVVVGQVGNGAIITIDPFVMSDREKTLMGSNYGSCRPAVDFPRFVNMALQGQLDLDLLVARTINLDGVNDAFIAMGKGEAGRSIIVFDD